MNKVMVWGADGGIGSALCEVMVNEGWQVVGIARNNSRMPEAVSFISADVSDRHSVDPAVYEAGIKFDAYDVYIYAAGAIRALPIGKLKEDHWQSILEANLGGVHRTLHASLPLLNPDASIVIIGADVGRITTPGLSAYAAAKAGLETYLSVAAKEDRNRKYLVVRPQAVDTAFWENVPFSTPKSALAPQTVAESILKAIIDKSAGHLDLK